MNHNAQAGFASSNPLGCESAFYSLMTALAPKDECVSYFKGCDEHLELRNDITDFVRQTVTTLARFCALPFQEGDVNLLKSSEMRSGLVRVGSDNSSFGFAFKVCQKNSSNQNPCDAPEVAYAILNSDLNFVRGIAQKSQLPHNHREEHYQLSNLIHKGTAPTSFFSPKQTGEYYFEGNKISHLNCKDTCNCHNTLLGYSGLHGMSEKVGRFITEVAGGIQQLCSRPNIHVPIDAKHIDSALYLGEPIARQKFSLILRLCQAGITQDNKSVCIPRDNLALRDPQVETLANKLGNGFITGRSANPYFVVAHVELPYLKNLELQLIHPGRNWELKRDFNDEDFKALENLQDNKVGTIEGLGKKVHSRPNIIGLGQLAFTLPSTFKASSFTPTKLKLDQKDN